MRSKQASPSKVPNRVKSGMLRLLHWLRGSVFSVENSLSSWRILPFLLKRTHPGRWLAIRKSSLRFYGHRFAYAQVERFSTIRKSAIFAGWLVRMAALPIILASLALALLFELPFAYSNLASRFGWPAVLIPKIDDAIYSTMMGTIALAMATVLALFFTVIGVVASTTYAKVPTEVRLLVANDDLNRRYLWLLAHTAAVAAAAFLLVPSTHQGQPC